MFIKSCLICSLLRVSLSSDCWNLVKLNHFYQYSARSWTKEGGISLNKVTNPRCCPIIAGAPSVVTGNIFFISISLSLKFLVKISSFFFFSSTLHMFQATKLFMYFAATAEPSHNC